MADEARRTISGMFRALVEAGREDAVQRLVEFQRGEAAQRILEALRAHGRRAWHVDLSDAGLQTLASGLASSIQSVIHGTFMIAVQYVVDRAATQADHDRETSPGVRVCPTCHGRGAIDQRV